MKRGKRPHAKHATLRLPAEIQQAVSQLAGGTGWSASKALAFMASAGWNALNSAGDRIPAMRQVLSAAVAHHETEVAMRKRLAAATEKLRVARRALGSPS